MARPLRLAFPGSLYHLTARGNARQDIFLDDQDRRAFLELLELSRYVVLNPVRAGMVKRVEQWAWSSDRVTAG